MKRFLVESLLVCGALALILRVLARSALAKPVTNSPSYDAAFYDEVDTYVEAQRQRLNMPGVSLAIVEGEEIVHLRGFGQARPGGEAPWP